MGSGIHLETRRNRSFFNLADDTYPIGKVRSPEGDLRTPATRTDVRFPASLLVGELRVEITDQKSGGFAIGADAKRRLENRFLEPSS
jgi:hypothetical protein